MTRQYILNKSEKKFYYTLKISERQTKVPLLHFLGILFSRFVTATCHSTAPVLHWPFDALRMKSLATHDRPWLTSQPLVGHTLDSALSRHAHPRQMSGVASVWVRSASERLPRRLGVRSWKVFAQGMTVEGCDPPESMLFKNTIRENK